MLRSQPRRDTWFAWLRVVAIRQAWEQCTRSRNERPAGAFISPDASELSAYEYPDPPAECREIPDQVADRIQHVQRLADLAAIKPNDRRTSYLISLGYRYTEIMSSSRASTSTWLSGWVRTSMTCRRRTPSLALVPGDSVADARGALALASSSARRRSH